MASVLGQFTPIDRRPVAYNTGPVDAIRIENTSVFAVRIILGGALYDIVPANKDATYTVTNLTGYAGWVLLIPATPQSSLTTANQITAISYGSGDVIPNGAITQQSQAAYRPNMVNPDPILDSLRGALSFNVKVFGAQGDGVTNDQPALQACATAASICGGGDVYLPSGTYLVTPQTDPAHNTYQAGVILGSNTRLHGAGKGATIIKMAATSPNQSNVVYSYDQTHVTIENLTIDGNSANQGSLVDRQMGTAFYGVRAATFSKVEWLNCFGLTSGPNGPNGTAGEGFLVTVDECIDVTFTDSHCVATDTNTASGFSANYTDQLRYVGCSARGLNHSNCFTAYDCDGVTYSACYAYSGGSDGFHIEQCHDVTYVGCQSGGISNDTTPDWYPVNTSLGNAGNGFQCYQSDEVIYSACRAIDNVQWGFHVDPRTSSSQTYVSFIGVVADGNSVGTSTYGALGITGAPTAGYAHIIGGVFTNSHNGLSLPDQYATISGNPFNNCAAQLGTTTTGYVNMEGLLSYTPAVPASGNTLTNPFPFRVLVSITGGTGVAAVAIDTHNIAVVPPCLVPLGIGEQISIAYTTAPTWLWFTA